MLFFFTLLGLNSVNPVEDSKNGRQKDPGSLINCMEYRPPLPVSPFTYIKLGHIKEIILKATEILGIFVIAVYTDKCNVFESGSFHLFFFFSFSLQQF